MRAFVAAALLVACAPQFTSNSLLNGVIPQLNLQNIPNLPTIDSLLSEPALTTSFADTYPEAASSAIASEPAAFIDMATMPRTDDGKYVLWPGFYHLEADSFCLRAGTHGPSQGDGYLAASLIGKKKDIIYKILSTYTHYPSLTQQQVQVLLWAIIARTKFSDMPPQVQRTASMLLDQQELFDLNGGLLGVIPDAVWNSLQSQLPPAVQQVYAAERNLRAMLATANADYRSLESVAVLAGAAPASDTIRTVATGTWTQTPFGYDIRYITHGYQHTSIELYIPERKNADETTIFDPSILAGTPANTSAQREGIGNPPIVYGCTGYSAEAVKGSFKRKTESYQSVYECACKNKDLSKNVRSALRGYFKATSLITDSYDNALDRGTNFSPGYNETLNQLSDTIYVANQGVIKSVVRANKLISPLDGTELNNSLEWIVDEAIYEQNVVQKFLDTDKNMSILRDHQNRNINYYGVFPIARDYNNAYQATVWAKDFLGRDLDYGVESDRVALSVAMAFNTIGTLENKYLSFMSSNMKDYTLISLDNLCQN